MNVYVYVCTTWATNFLLRLYLHRGGGEDKQTI